jgi:hypothetical protein
MGTPNYMSPEQVRGEKATSRSDVFSLGAVFYELLTNRKPFEADSLHAVLFQVMQHEPESLATVAPGVPPALRQVVERAMLKDPAGRYRDGADLREALRPVRAGLGQWTAGASLPPTSSDATIVGNVVITPPPPAPKPATRPPAPLSQPPAEPTVAHLAAPPAPAPPPRVVGTNALDAQPQREEPATVAPTPVGTLSGRASTQVPAASPPAPEAGPSTPIPQSAPPPPVVASPPAPVAAPPAPAPVLAPPPPVPKAEPPAAKSQPPEPAPVVPPPAAPPAPEPTRTIAAKGKGKQKEKEKEKEKAAPPVVLAPPPPVVAPRPTPPAPAAVVAPPAAAPAARLTPPSTPKPATLPPRPVESPRTIPPEPVRLSGETTRPQTVASAGSKLPIVAGGAVAVVVLAVGAYMLTRPDPTPSPTPSPATASTTLAPRVDPAVAGHVDAAQKALAGRHYKDAVARADQALQKDPQNAAARQVKEQAETSLRQIDSAAADARKALAANDTATAGRAIEQLTALDPQHPAIAEARTTLAAFFRTRAEAAQRGMQQAQRSATSARATTQADYKSAVLLAREADALFRRGDFAPATQKFQDARVAYENALRAQGQTAAATPTPAPTAAATTAPPTTTLAAQVTTTTTLPATATPANEEPAIRRVLAQLERAYETGDTALWQSIRAGATDAETKAVAAKNWKDVNVTVNSIDMQGPSKATVRIGRRDVGLDGKTYPFQQTLVLVKDASGWKISSIGR